jgi:hypothetical protein
LELAEEYDEVILDVGMPIIRSTFTDDDRQHLYVLTPGKVTDYLMKIKSQYPLA